jgi:hypothetical protein
MTMKIPSLREMAKMTKIFIVGSSFPIFLITMVYVGMAFNRSGRLSSVPYELFPVFIPVLYGIYSIINYYVVKSYGVNSSLIVGIVFGLMLSTIGRFGLDLPRKIFGFTKSNAHMVHLYAAALYAMIFRFVVTPVTMFMLH